MMIKQIRLSMLSLTILIFSTNDSSGKIPEIYCPAPPESLKLVKNCIEYSFFVKNPDEIQDFTQAKHHLGDMDKCNRTITIPGVKSYFSKEQFLQTINGATVNKCEYGSDQDVFICYVDLNKEACVVDLQGHRRKSKKAKIIVGKSSGYLVSFYPIKKF